MIPMWLVTISNGSLLQLIEKTAVKQKAIEGRPVSSRLSKPFF
jgi:hypothetical protein